MQPPAQIDHVGIAVHSLEEASRLYRDVLGLECVCTEEIPNQKVKVSFFQIGEIRIELLEPTADDSPIHKFLVRRGPGFHHIAYRVVDLSIVLAELKAAGVRLIDETPRDGAHDMKIAFVHPESTDGVLTEFCEPVR
jgi:methylmalonyl-CoA/ethylmalonyl-CoA epimerase